MISTYLNAKKIRQVHAIKRRDNYQYNAADLTFDDNGSIIKVLAYCFIVGMLGGIVGIAGGIILGPVLL